MKIGDEAAFNKLSFMEKPLSSQRAGRRFCPSRGINRQVLPGLKGSVLGSAPRLIADLREFRFLNQ